MNNALPPHMRLALELAEKARPLCAPNPAVGCVLSDAQGHVIGQGHTQAAGQAHAEIMALQDAQSRGHDARGATAWVTLEPCSHHGRTAPCCDALIAAGIRQVFAACQDPNPQVAGQGFARLQAAGIELHVGAGARQAHELNIGFFKRMQSGRPWVRAKIAASLDGRTALPNGKSQWITGPAARADGHLWRARADAILTGIGTILADDPLLNVRLPAQTRQPALFIADSRLKTPLDARLWTVTGREVHICTARDDAAMQKALLARGADIIQLAKNQAGLLDVHAMLAAMAALEINELHLEAGASLTGSMLRENLVDELLVYQAPVLLGPGRAMAELDEILDLSQALRFVAIEQVSIGHDLRLRLRLRQAD